MSSITAITPLKKDPDCWAVKVDGKTAAIVTSGDRIELGLKVGDAWDEELAERAGRAQAIQSARQDALKRLGRRAFSRRQLTDKLRAKDHGDDAIEAALDRLEKVGLIDDPAFGRALIREASRAKPAGARLLRAKLFKAGLGESLIGELLAEQREDPAAVETARAKAIEMARKRYSSMGRYDAPTRKRRLYGMLARRGFDNDVIQDILRQVMTDDDDAGGVY